MNGTPKWYQDEVSRHAKLIVEKEETREAAMVSLRVFIRDDHREYGNSILDKHNAPELDAGIKAATPAPIAIPATALLAISDKGSLRHDEIVQMAAESAAHGEKVLAAMVEQKLVAEVGGRVRLTPAGEDASFNASLKAIQGSMFPFLAEKVRISPRVYRQIPEMSGKELDSAKAMVMAKTGNAIDGAKAEQERFIQFYDKVRPLIADDEYVSDALLRLAKKTTKVR